MNRNKTHNKEKSKIDKQISISVLLPLPFDRTFTYLATSDLNLKIGDFVKVPFGNKFFFGVVWRKSKSKFPKEKMKNIIIKFDHPGITEKMIDFVEWVASYTLSPRGLVLKMCMSVPEALSTKKFINLYYFSGKYPKRNTKERSSVISYLKKNEGKTINEITEKTNVNSSVIKSLIVSKSLNLREVEEKIETNLISRLKININLNEDQKNCARHLTKNVDNHSFSVNLIEGVTGSGKTEVYFQKIRQVLEDKKQVLILLPEIALTNQLIKNFENRFSFKPEVWHSNVSLKLRRNIWSKVSKGSNTVVIGARSALFLPFQNLGLIVVDEEHDHTYKQEESVLYHARDMAIVRASLERIPIILSSATPSVETIINIEKNKYNKIVLPSRYGNANLPTIKAIDMRKEQLSAGKCISNKLRIEIGKTLRKNEQILLFINRRGYAPLVLCNKCGYRFECKNCSQWLVMHRNKKLLICHHCGYQISFIDFCPACNNNKGLVLYGPGVERVASEAKGYFPNKEIVVFSSDTVGSKQKLRNAFLKIENNEAQIIVGTQLLAKGHHFPNLTCVGIIDADMSLSGGDIRAFEKTHQLLTQISGRAGRVKKDSFAFIQTYMPDHVVIKSLLTGDRSSFVAKEIETRKLYGLPPFKKFVSILISGKKLDKVKHTAFQITKKFPKSDDIEILGPASAPLSFLRGKHRMRILIKANIDIHLQKLLKNWLTSINISRDTKIAVDIDPRSFL